MFELIIALAQIEDESDREFLERLFIRYEKSLKRCAMDILENESDAEDCLIDSFVKITDYLEKYKSADEEYRKNLLFLTCKNNARTMLKKINRQRSNEMSMGAYEDDEKTSENEFVDLDENIEKIAITRHTQALVREVLNKLKPHHKEILVLKFYHGMSNREIADFLEMKENAVVMRLKRAKEELIKKGGDELYDLAQC